MPSAGCRSNRSNASPCARTYRPPQPSRVGDRGRRCIGTLGHLGEGIAHLNVLDEPGLGTATAGGLGTVALRDLRDLVRRPLDADRLILALLACGITFGAEAVGLAHGHHVTGRILERDLVDLLERTTREAARPLDQRLQPGLALERVAHSQRSLEAEVSSREHGVDPGQPGDIAAEDLVHREEDARRRQHIAVRVVAA